MTPLDKLAEIVAGMTSGRWHSKYDAIFSDNDRIGCMDGYSERNGDIWTDNQESDARGIALLRNIAPELIAVARAAQAEAPCVTHAYEKDDLRQALAALDAALEKEGV